MLMFRTALVMVFNFLLVALAVLSAYVVTLLVLARRRQMVYPEKSLFYCFMNEALGPLRYFGLYPYKHKDVSVDRALKSAMKLTKLNDYGDSKSFVDLYHLVMNTAFHRKQRLTNLGYFASEIELHMIFVGRLKKLKYVNDNPQILNVPVREPVFVTGLPRTGTTFLHRLLSLDPAVRSPLLWELVNSVPIVKASASAEEKEKCRKKRRDFVVKMLKQRDMLGDESLTHIHEIGADLPEECLMAIREEVPLNLQHLLTLYMEYDELIPQVKMTPAYQYYKMCLQLLSFANDEVDNPRRWMLKCPMHLIFTKEIKSVFPDAKIIWTHRHPVSAVPSMCSLLKSCHLTYFEKEGRDDHAIGKQLKNVSAQWLQQGPKDMKEANIPCCDVVYNDLIKDPIGTVKRIYSYLGWEFTAEYEEILQQYLEVNRREREAARAKQGTAALHTYEPEEFGLTAQELSEGVFREYIEKYNLPMSKN